MSALVLAADYPERVRSLVIVNGAARALWAPDYPVGADTRARADPFTTVALDPDAVEQGFDVLEIARAERRRTTTRSAVVGPRRQPRASPSMARAVDQVLAEADVRDTLARITAPTLILHRDDVACSSRSGTAATSPSTSRAHATSSCPAPTRCTGSATPHRFSTRSRSSSPVSAAARTPNACSPQSFSPTSSARPQRAAALGDVRWHDLLDNHDNIVRHELERFRGREVNTAGDGFVATFTSPSVAIDCADAIVDAVRALGIEVRVGIHAGEVEVRGDDIAGMAVHIGARVAALAGPSEVLVSSTVREIVTGSDARSPSAANTTSRACPVDGGCTPWPATDAARRSARTRIRRRRSCAGSPTASRR